ncbi:hypothetical protein CROQUDRAFT_46043, partial [Cronartium quercuum f. sp. fusiforme G11]
VFSSLFNLHCDESDLQKFIFNVKRTLNELAVMGVKTYEEMIASFVLHLLPESFSNLKTVITHGIELVDQTLTVDSILNHLQQTINNKKILALDNNPSPSGNNPQSSVFAV